MLLVRHCEHRECPSYSFELKLTAAASVRAMRRWLRSFERRRHTGLAVACAKSRRLLLGGASVATGDPPEWNEIARAPAGSFRDAVS